MDNRPIDNRIVNLFGDDRRPERAPGKIDLAHQGDIDLGQVTVVPSRRVLQGPGGEVMVEPKVMQVLVALASPPGRILSRDDLIERCWEGRIVGDASINRVISLLRGALRDAGPSALEIDTVPRVGYRIVGHDSDVPETSTADAARTEGKQRQSLTATLMAGLLVALVAISAIAWWASRPGPAQGELTIAMMPVEDASGSDPFFARGLEAEVRSELARGDGLVVTVSSTADQLSAAKTDPTQLGDVLGADYIWQGRLSRQDGSVLLHSRLLDTTDGSTVFEERLASGDASVASMPVRTARSLLRALDRLPANAVASAAISPDDHSLYLTALGLIRSRDPPQIASARTILDGLTERNPAFSGGWSALAKAIFLSGDADARGDTSMRPEALRFAKRALDLDPASVEALKTAGMLAPESSERFDLMQRAVKVDPGDSEAWLWLSHVAAHPDYAEMEGTAARKVVELDPLWSRAWQASYAVSEVEGARAAIAVERMIERAAVEDWQRKAALGRIANIEGDLSRFLRLSLEAMPGMTPGQQQLTNMQMANMRLMMGLPIIQPNMDGPLGVILDVTAGELPSRGAFEDAGLWGGRFWQTGPLVIAGPSLFIRDGRAAEIVEIYDASFKSPEDLARFAEGQIRPHHFRTNIATYVGLAMKKVGRGREARELFAFAERSIARWRAGGSMGLTPLLFESNLAAAQGQTARAVSALESMIAMGWPYILHSPGVPLTGPLLDDPAWADLQDDPLVIEVLAATRRDLARERQEIAAITAN